MRRNEYIALVFVGLFIFAGVWVAVSQSRGPEAANALATEKPHKQVDEPTKTQSGYSIPAAAPADWKARADTPANWTYDSQKDGMRNQAIYFACNTSTNTLQFDFPYNGGSSAQLCFRQSARSDNDVYLTVSKGQFYCTSYDGCTIHAKFDGGSVVALHASGASGGDTTTVFISGYKRFSDRIKKAKHLFIEAEFYQEGRRQMEFDVQGYAGVRPPTDK